LAALRAAAIAADLLAGSDAECLKPLSAASEAAMRAAAEPGRTRGAPLPGSSGVSGGRFGSIGWRAGPLGIALPRGRCCGAGGGVYSASASGAARGASGASCIDATSCAAVGASPTTISGMRSSGESAVGP
jgi:hypothetical protein